MPIDVATHPQYGAAAAKFNADKAAATAGGDTAALATAEAEWANARLQMTNDLGVRQEQAMQRTTRLAQIKAANPNVDEALYNDIDDLDKAERVAAEFQKVSAAHQATGSWSPAPGGGQTPPAEPRPEDMTPEEHEEARVKRMNEISPDVMRRGALARAENEELQRLSLEPITSRFTPKR